MTAMHMLMMLLLGAVPAIAVVVWAAPRKSSRRWLTFALSLSLPIVGPLLAIMACKSRGTDQLSRDMQQSSPKRRYDPPRVIERLAGMPPLLDRLVSKTPSERLTGMVTLADRADAESVEMLRWTIEHGGSDAVLDAALTLEAMELRWQSQLREALDALQQRATVATALAAGQRAAQGILAGLAEPSRIPGLLKTGRRCYEQARLLNRASQNRLEQDYDIGMHHAILEVAVGKPRTAVAVLESLLIPSRHDAPSELWEVLARARFASREAYRTDRDRLPLQNINSLSPHWDTRRDQTASRFTKRAKAQLMHDKSVLASS